MNRDIKFRAWRESEKIMLCGETLKWLMSEDCRPSEEDIYMQYVGLKDKNGKEIYEGDVVVNIDGDILSRNTKGVVTMKNGAWGYETEYDFIFLGYTTCEITGNQFENPDLLSNK